MQICVRFHSNDINWENEIGIPGRTRMEPWPILQPENITTVDIEGKLSHQNNMVNGGLKCTNHSPSL